MLRGERDVVAIRRCKARQRFRTEADVADRLGVNEAVRLVITFAVQMRRS